MSDIKDCDDLPEDAGPEDLARLSVEVPAGLDAEKIVTLVNLFLETTLQTCSPREAITVYLNAIGRIVMLSSPNRAHVEDMIPHLQADVGAFLRAIWNEGVRDGLIPLERDRQH